MSSDLQEIKDMQCEKCKKEPATIHTTEMSCRKVKKEVHLCKECMGETRDGHFVMLDVKIQCDKCAKQSGIMFLVKLSHPNAKPKKGYLCEKCIIEVRDRIQCKRCKRELGHKVSIPQDIRSKMLLRGRAIALICCDKCSGTSGATGTTGDAILNYPE